MLILHSDNDGSVPVQQALDMAEALEKAKAPHRLSIYKKKGHMRVTEDVIKETRAFIEEISKSKLDRGPGGGISKEKADLPAPTHREVRARPFARSVRCGHAETTNEGTDVVRRQCLCVLLITLIPAFASRPRATAADWPQFMRDAAHTGDAADEALRLPLGLVAQVKLDDAVLTSAGGRRGPRLRRRSDGHGLLHRSARRDASSGRPRPTARRRWGPTRPRPASPSGRVYFGTTAGTFHILDAADGKLIKTLHDRLADRQRADLRQRLRSTSRRSTPCCAASTSTATSAGSGTTTPATRSRRR